MLTLQPFKYGIFRTKTEAIYIGGLLLFHMFIIITSPMPELASSLTPYVFGLAVIMWCAVRIGERLIGVVPKALLYVQWAYYDIRMLGLSLYFAVRK